MSDKQLNMFTPQRKGSYREFRLSENNCIYIGRNSQRKNARQFKVDGDIFPSGSSHLRCDYLLLNDDDHKAYYIELKGSDILHAIAQIEATIASLHASIKEYTVFKRIIYHSGTHNIRSSRVIRWKRGKFSVVKERQYSEEI